MPNNVRALGLLALITAAAGSASATTLTFDNLTIPVVPVTTPYDGFAFNNFSVNTLSNAKPSGYVNGTVSPSSVIYNSFGLDANFTSANSSLFTLNDFYLTAAINNGLSVTVSGSAAGSTLYSKTFTVSTTAPTLELLDWVGIDSVSFTSSGGTLDPTAALYYATGSQFVLDNVRYDEALTPPVASTPEPGTLGLLGTGLVGLAAMRRRFAFRR